MGRDVAAAARVRVCQPGAAHVVGFFDQGYGVVVLLANQLDGEAEAGLGVC